MQQDWQTASRIKPTPESRVLARARDDKGRYELPFPVRFRGGAWYNARNGALIEVRIEMWRHATKDSFRPDALPVQQHLEEYYRH
jgi:hypothetical protein